MSSCHKKLYSGEKNRRTTPKLLEEKQRRWRKMQLERSEKIIWSYKNRDKERKTGGQSHRKSLRWEHLEFATKFDENLIKNNVSS
jgi:hypothetical protein